MDERDLLGRAVIRYFRAADHPAKYRIERWIGRWAMPAEGIATTVMPGIRLYLHPSDWIEYILLRGMPYEKQTLRFIASNLAAGDAALLAGVNMGLHVAVAARAAGPSGRVLGVEPQPAALLKASRNLALNGLSGGVELVAAALGDEQTMVSLPSPVPGNAGASSLLDVSASGIVVPLLPARVVLGDRGVRRLRLALLDVQGFELKALEGFRGGPLPDLFVVEFSEEFQSRAGSDNATLARTLLEFGYALHLLHGAPVDPGHAPDGVDVVAARPGCAVAWAPAPARQTRADTRRPRHSWRSAVIGTTRVARRAGR